MFSDVLRFFGSVAVAALSFAAPAAAQCPGLKLSAPVPQSHDYMGPVALGPDALLVGASGYAAQSGAAFVFDPATGARGHVLIASDAEEQARFGLAVALSGRWAAIGAPGARFGGAAYLFDVATGAELHRLLPTVPVLASGFGLAVAIEDDVVAVGAPGTFPFPPDDGVVHVFDRATGIELYALPSPDPSGGFVPNSFGTALDLDQGRLLTGASGTDSAGAVYLFDAASGVQLLKLEPPPGSDPEAFGSSVDLHGRLAAVGDYGAFGNRGAVHVFDVPTGQHHYSVIGPDGFGGTIGTAFGSSVAIGERLLAIGAPYQTRQAAQGVVHLHAVETGAPAGGLVGHPAATTHRFGSSLSCSGRRLAAGDVQDSEAALYAGAAYLFSFPPCP